ncbi:bifunctional 4-hydroxy-2-oxoglutarate aldolase/2-dehydro-3-deoxy-phosphogluconate aldolase [Ornithinimicrobium sediminis]|uniref:bifunctional 4-hydroxy-2-oxoglutarate aldolase/2-dehydro-3-deoxy-phosphogluconate aldolase n=1 Tax=Ornithinimicrobium sediminis TaxID=2904603 RepID=UPI001E2F6C11|nr:bifunctional 4-hydroxy-2-oxoglutarate aldolase/2-dehydro-3-deoxy-phosphogluconate aldolase [Ornithinimicrobium sediminis]MCE0487390.1 bifunctional 4-hydroxy-2-oxoglutarate aldolase/2-dehydro-3-deoxy-phosphogluconate aldolase [Ornithinimicrobium sediminis]
MTVTADDTDTTHLLSLAPVIPVAVLLDPDKAVPMARALARGGVGVIEVTLRTDTALESIRRIAEDVPEIRVGAGTVTSTELVVAAQRAGAQFLVTPGSPTLVLDAAIDSGLPVLPGATTLTEMMTLLERGLTAQKFFPAVPAGGTAYLEAVHGPLPQVRFCPTGGITHENAPAFLALPNVGCVGGSWLTPGDAVRADDWDAVSRLAAAAVGLRG